MTGFPDWLWAALAIVLPVFYQAVLGKLPGLVKFLLTWGLTAALCAVVGFLFLGWHNIGDLVGAYAWLIAAMQAVYHLMVKPIARRLAAAAQARQSAGG